MADSKQESFLDLERRSSGKMKVKSRFRKTLSLEAAQRLATSAQ